MSTNDSQGSSSNSIRLSVPAYTGLPRVQRAGSIIYDGLDKSLYYSDGNGWRQTLNIQSGGGIGNTVDLNNGSIINVNAITGNGEPEMSGQPFIISNPPGCVVLKDVNDIRGCSNSISISSSSFGATAATTMNLREGIQPNVELLTATGNLETLPILGGGATGASWNYSPNDPTEWIVGGTGTAPTTLAEAINRMATVISVAHGPIPN